MVLKLISAAFVVLSLAACSPNADVAPQSESRSKENTAIPAMPVTEQAASPVTEQAVAPAAEPAAEAPAAMPTEGGQQ